MELEVNKLYEIKAIDSSGAKVVCGLQIVSWTDGKMFTVLGQCLSYTIEAYTFTRLPSFGDRVEFLNVGGKIKNVLGYSYYVGENAMVVFAATSTDDNFSKALFSETFLKSDYDVRLKPQPPATFEYKGKIYLRSEVDKCFADLKSYKK